MYKLQNQPQLRGRITQPSPVQIAVLYYEPQTFRLGIVVQAGEKVLQLHRRRPNERERARTATAATEGAKSAIARILFVIPMPSCLSRLLERLACPDFSDTLAKLNSRDACETRDQRRAWNISI